MCERMMAQRGEVYMYFLNQEKGMYVDMRAKTCNFSNPDLKFGGHADSHVAADSTMCD